MAAVLTAAAGHIDDVAKSVAECGRLGVVVLPADVNHGSAGFTIEQLPEGQLPDHANRQGVRFGLSAVRNVGDSPIAARDRRGASATGRLPRSKISATASTALRSTSACWKA